MADPRYRLAAGDDDYGLICPVCAGRKNAQHARCSRCHLEAVRDERYWTRRTCACGQAKHPTAARCRLCANRLLVGNTYGARRQPGQHPWRALRFGR